MTNFRKYRIIPYKFAINVSLVFCKFQSAIELTNKPMIRKAVEIKLICVTSYTSSSMHYYISLGLEPFTVD